MGLLHQHFVHYLRRGNLTVCRYFPSRLFSGRRPPPGFDFPEETIEYSSKKSSDNNRPKETNEYSSKKSSDNNRDVFLRLCEFLGQTEKNALNKALKPSVNEILKNLCGTNRELTVKSGLDTAASIDILKLFNASTAKLNCASKKAREAAMLMEAGERLVETGKELMNSAFDEVSKSSAS
ncbi:hypothetical protein NMG60_11014985 [Bertholletia excelsa]